MSTADGEYIPLEEGLNESVPHPVEDLADQTEGSGQEQSRDTTTGEQDTKLSGEREISADQTAQEKAAEASDNTDPSDLRFQFKLGREEQRK